MKLEFKVLWFDDTSEFFDSLDLTGFKDRVRSWGFDPQIDVVYSPAAFLAKDPFHQYDLIAVDYDLGEREPHGGEFIRRLRDNRIYTEVVFYSAKPASDLWAAISGARLEGVYVANRQVIAERLENIAHQSMRKVLDLNNMRGMVMAEVGDIDNLLDSILRTGMAHLPPDQQSDVFSRFHAEANAQTNSHLLELRAFHDAPDVEQMIRLSDSNKRFANFNRLRSRHEKVREKKIGDYIQDVLSPRNYLAHGQPREVDGGYVFSYNGKEYLFNEEASLALRRTILGYREKFREVHSMLAEQIV